MESDVKKTIIETVKTYSGEILKDNLLFANIFGSFVYNDNFQNDVDLMFVTKEPLLHENKNKMIAQYIQLHKILNLKPDKDYPGEYLCRNDLKNSCNGEGFLYDKQVIIPEINGWEWDSFNNPRHNLTAIGGVTEFITGDKKEYEKTRSLFLKTILDVFLLTNSSKKFDLDSLTMGIIGSGEKFLGFENNKVTQKYLKESFKGEINTMIESGLLSFQNQYFKVNKNHYWENLEDSIKKYNEAFK